MLDFTVDRLGPIRYFTLRSDPRDVGGVMVVKGPNGSGKTTLIAVLRALFTGNGRFTPTDGEKKGTAEGAGRSLSVTSQNRFSGECDVPTLEGKFDFSDLVNPLKKTRETRDADRLKAFLTLSGVQVRIEDFYELCGGKDEFDRIVPADVRKLDGDIVAFADKVRRALHAEAKRVEEQSKTHHADWLATQKLLEGVDLTKDVDLDALHRRSQELAAESQSLVEQRKAALEAAKKADEAREKIAAMKSASVITVEEAANVVEASQKRIDTVTKDIERIQRELERAKAELRVAEAEKQTAHQQLEAAKSAERLLGSYQRAIDAADVLACPSEDEIKAAEAKSAAILVEIEAAYAHKQAASKHAQGLASRDRARQLERQATSWRERADGCDDILSKSLPSGPLKWKDGGLVLDTERGENVPFDECSEGEKWSVALPYGIQSVGKGGILPVVQDAWQDLDAENRMKVATACESAGVWIVTGEVADGVLRAEKFELAKASK